MPWTFSASFVCTAARDLRLNLASSSPDPLDTTVSSLALAAEVLVRVFLPLDLVKDSGISNSDVSKAVASLIDARDRVFLVLAADTTDASFVAALTRLGGIVAFAGYRSISMSQ